MLKALILLLVPVTLVAGVAVQEVRLTGGRSESTGRAEVKVGGVWGTVCDPAFGKNGWPLVFCKQLGFKNILEAKLASAAGLPVSNLPVLFQDPGCNPSTAQNMATCAQASGKCGHEKDIWINCAGEAVQEVRLAGGGRGSAGRAEVKVGGVWGTVCDPYFFKTGWPTVFCKELGFNNIHEAKLASAAGLPVSNLPVLFTDPACSTSNAQNMATCEQESGKCGHEKDVWIDCTGGKEIFMLLDCTGSMASSTVSYMPKAVEFLDKFFQFSSSDSFWANEKTYLRVIPFTTSIDMGDEWNLDYGAYQNAAALRASERNGMNNFRNKLLQKAPSSLTNLGQTMADVKTQFNPDSSKMVIVVSDFINIKKSPDFIASMTALKNKGAHVFPVLLDKPIKDQDVYDAAVAASKDNLGLDIAKEGGVPNSVLQSFYNKL